jgi:hypothetical protein
MIITYILGRVDLENGEIFYEKETYKTPDEALYILKGIISSVIKEKYDVYLKNSAIHDVNFILNDIPTMIIDKNLSMECVKNQLEDLQVLLYKKVTHRGYMYNTSSVKSCYNFFLKQISTPEFELTPEVKSLVESFQEMSFLEELKKSVKVSKLLKTPVPRRRTVFQNDFQRELSQRVIKKH